MNSSFHINYISNLLNSNTNNTIYNYVVGGIVGGSIYGLVIFLNPLAIIGLVSFYKVIATTSCIGIGSYIMDSYGTNYYKELNNIRKECLDNNSDLSKYINDNNKLHIYKCIHLILNSNTNSIGKINYEYLNIYKIFNNNNTQSETNTQPDSNKCLQLLKYHIKHISMLIIDVFNISDNLIIEYINRCIQRIIYNQTYSYIINIIDEITDNQNLIFIKQKNNPILYKKLQQSSDKYKLNYLILTKMMNNMIDMKNITDKISCIETICNQINIELNKNDISADDLLDILPFIIIKSNIENPYTELMYMNEYIENLIDKNAYLLIMFHSAVDYIKNYNYI